MRIDESGQGPAVLLLHGNPTDGPRFFAPLVRDLSRDHRVLVSIQPGYLGTQAPEGDPFEEPRAQLLEALAARGISRLSIVGFSGGAYQALQLSLSGGIRVDSLVLLGGFACPTAEHRAAFLDLAKQFSPLPDFKDPTLRRNLAALFVAPKFATAHPERMAELEGWLDATTPKHFARECSAFAAFEDLRPRLSELFCPVTVRVGELDVAVPPAYSEEIARLVPHATLQKVPGCGHALLIEDEQATVAAVRRAVAAA